MVQWSFGPLCVCVFGGMVSVLRGNKGSPGEREVSAATSI